MIERLKLPPCTSATMYNWAKSHIFVQCPFRNYFAILLQLAHSFEEAKSENG